MALSVKIVIHPGHFKVEKIKLGQPDLFLWSWTHFISHLRGIFISKRFIYLPTRRVTHLLSLSWWLNTLDSPTTLNWIWKRVWVWGKHSEIEMFLAKGAKGLHSFYLLAFLSVCIVCCHHSACEATAEGGSTPQNCLTLMTAGGGTECWLFILGGQGSKWHKKWVILLQLIQEKATVLQSNSATLRVSSCTAGK